jgi:hypothetical protein
MKTTVNTYSERHLSQLIRRSMIQKVKPCGKVYSRKKKVKVEW